MTLERSANGGVFFTLPTEAVATEDGIFWTHEGSLIAVRPQ